MLKANDLPATDINGKKPFAAALAVLMVIASSLH